MKMTQLNLRRAFLPALCLAFMGCSGKEFDPFGRLTSLRILAIQSDPVAPGPGESTTLTPLLYVPEGHSAPELTWSWCPFPSSGADGYECQFEPEQLGAFAENIQLPPLELGHGETASFENSLDPMLLSMLCSGGPEAAVLLHCDDGFPVQVKLTAKTDKEEVQAVRTLNLRFEESTPPNSNPELAGLEVKIEDEWLEVTPDFAQLLRRDETTELRAIVDDNQAEAYQTLNAAGELINHRERLTVSWFVETGSTRYERTGFIDSVSSLDILRENEWVPERTEDYAKDSAEIIMVIRDNREGSSWQRYTLGLTEAP